MRRDEGKDDGVDILLTTYPEHGSQNVGDQLMSESALKLIRHRVPEYEPIMLFREEPLERFGKSSARTILAPGFSVNSGTYPDLFRLYKDLEGVADIFYPVRCSFQRLVPVKDTYEQYEYWEETRLFLRTTGRSSGPLPCRDQLSVDMLSKHEAPGFYCGDLTSYDEEVIGTEFIPPADVKSVVSKVQHKPKLILQSFVMLNLIRAQFPDAISYVAQHSKVNKLPAGLGLCYVYRFLGAGFIRWCAKPKYLRWNRSAHRV